jgi:hypothetical protein
MKRKITETSVELAVFIAVAIFSTACTQANSVRAHDRSRAEVPAVSNSETPVPKTGANAANPRSAPSHKPKANACAKSTTVPFAGLSEFIGNHLKRRNGECMIITDVPVFSGVQNAEDEYGNHKGQYYLTLGEEMEVSTTFVSSPALAKAVATRLKQPQTTSLRVTAVRIQFSDDIEVFWSPYAVKVEGLGDNREVLWTVSGDPPGKLKFPV